MEYMITDKSGLNFGKKTSICECIEQELSPGELFTLFGDQRESIIQSVAGSLWITQENDTDDYRVNEGDSFTIFKSGKVVIQGMPTAHLRFMPASTMVLTH